MARLCIYLSFLWCVIGACHFAGLGWRAGVAADFAFLAAGFLLLIFRGARSGADKEAND